MATQFIKPPQEVSLCQITQGLYGCPIEISSRIRGKRGIGKMMALPNKERLAQPTTFKPFMQEFVMLLEVTSRAGNYKVARAIRSASTKGYDVVYMVLFKFLVAIVTLAMLALILSLNIFLSMRACRLLLESSTFIGMRPISFWMFLRVNFSSLSTLLHILPIVISSVSRAVLCVQTIIITNTGFMILSIFLIHIAPIPGFLCQISLPSCRFTWLAFRMQRPLFSISQIKVLSSSRLNSLACSALSKSLRRSIQGFFSITPNLAFRAFAYFAQCCQVIRFGLVGPKELFGSRLMLVTASTKLQWVRLLWGWIDLTSQISNRLHAQCIKIKRALGYILRYSSIHSLGHSLLSRPPVIAVTRGTNHIQLPQVYHKPAPQARLCPFLSLKQRRFLHEI